MTFDKGKLSRRTFLQTGVAAGLVAPWIGRSAFAQSLAGKTIGFTQSFVTTQWIREQREGVVTTAKKYGLETVVLDAANRPAKQISDIEDLVTRQVDAILISTYFSEAIAPAVREANKAGIPVIVLSSGLVGDVDWAVQLSVDSFDSGRTAGEYFVKRLNGKGNVVQIEGSPGSTVNQNRGKGWHDVIDKVPDIKIVGHVMADYDRAKALKGMEDMLQANEKVDGVYVHSEDMALGAIQAIHEAGREKEMFVVGYDGVANETLKAIYEEKLAMVMSYHPFGVEGVEAAVRVLESKPIPKNISFPAPMIDKSNVLDYYDATTNKAKLAPSRLEAMNLPDK
ncbi:sugar ABC transporter substrate-binding protein [Rhizobium sp. P32RR-XVIII]|uniref:substrate-binding domain-containing protein n=1 Tax=Rhizobium sp. P32RR-XVIII TaxID=2726738 RepID=UPI0014570169|nr:substrate-binding domain-containing protein [Rhizobium sp. P32RR-XVIII]NLS07341.1 sugar ABC transporter substrate-binding protein [Rhizobium sp. P32RR-XVIII]